MDRLVRIDDAQAFVRLPRGVYKQVDLYARGERVFIPHGGGFARVCADVGDGWATSSPGIKVLEISDDNPHLWLEREPKYRPPAAIKAVA